MSDAATRGVLIFTSPKAGTGQGHDRVLDLEAALRRAGVPVSLLNAPAALRQRTSDLDEAMQPGLIVAAGGDGTLALVAQHASPQTPIVPMPLGTENLLARQFGYTNDVKMVTKTILEGHDQQIDAGLANGRLFLVMATCGFDAEVVRAMHLTRRGHITRWSYCGPILRAMRRYRFPELKVEIPDLAGAESFVLCRWAMLFNLPRYAASLGIEPEARETDGWLNLSAFTRGSLVGGFRYLAGIILGRHIGWSDVIRRPVVSCRITSSIPVAYQIDGDYAGKLPLNVAVLPGRIRLRLPPSPPTPSV